MSADTDTANFAQEDLDRCREILRELYGKNVDRGGVTTIAEFAQRFPREQRAFFIDYHDLERVDADIADGVLGRPDEWREYFEAALAEHPLPAPVDLDHATVRFANLPDRHERPIGSFRDRDIGELRLVSGQVTRQSAVKINPDELAFECQRCGSLTRVPQSGDTPQEPHQCKGCEREGPFEVDRNESSFTSAQLVRLQRPPEDATGGEGKAIDVQLNGEELIETADVGDRVRATVQVDIDTETDDMMWGWQFEGEHVDTEQSDFEDIEIEPYLDRIREVANSEDPYQTLVESIYPSHYGDEHVRLAVALQLFGGVRKDLDDGSTVRGDSHILWVGDPGTDKSGLLQYAREVAPRSVYTSGESASGAGLTAAAVKDDFGDSGGWTIKGGALVRASDGIACIDELDKMDEEERSKLNEALSQQTVSVQKAGEGAELPARTRLLAAANPVHGRWDQHAAIGEQINLPPSLVSRFDLIFTVSDDPDAGEDGELADHILDGHRAAVDSGYETETDVEPAIAPETLRAYIAHARQEYEPLLTDAAHDRIREAYTTIRDARPDDGSAAVPVTARKIEAYVRLAEAAARIRLSDTVEVADAELAIDIVRRSLEDVGIDPETGEFDADVVETGQSASQRERVHSIMAFIEDNQADYEDGVPQEDVIKFGSEELDTMKSKVLRELENLKNKGEVYEPGNDRYRTT